MTQVTTSVIMVVASQLLLVNHLLLGLTYNSPMVESNYHNHPNAIAMLPAHEGRDPDVNHNKIGRNFSYEEKYKTDSSKANSK